MFQSTSDYSADLLFTSAHRILSSVSKLLSRNILNDCIYSIGFKITNFLGATGDGDRLGGLLA